MLPGFRTPIGAERLKEWIAVGSILKPLRKWIAAKARANLGRHFLVNFDLTSEIWRRIGIAALPRGDIMRYQ